MSSTLALVEFFHDLPKPDPFEIVDALRPRRREVRPKKLISEFTAKNRSPAYRRLVARNVYRNSQILNMLRLEDLGVERLDKFLSPRSSISSDASPEKRSLIDTPLNAVVPDQKASKDSVQQVQKLEDFYVYEPLKPRTIRLLSIDQNTSYFSPTISVSIVEASLDNIPEYDALSYRWYSKMANSRIICDGKKHLIPKNCRRALIRLKKRNRLKNQNCLLWVDAISINQNDVAEKGEQVALMSEIYQKAQRTVVWLGEDKDLEASCLADIDAALPYLSGERPEFQSENASKKNPIVMLLHDPTYAPSKALTLLLTRAWFSRVWVLQEIALAKKILIICGSQESSWKAFSKFLKAMANASRLPSEWSHAWNLVTFRKEYRRSRHNGGVEPYSALFQARMCLASDPRDKVYALLGVCKHLATSVGKPDYTSPATDVWTRAFCECLKHKPSINALSLVVSGRRTLNLPSWVPDLDQYGKAWISRPRDAQSKDGTPKFVICHSDNGPSLVMWGKIIDTVDTKFDYAKAREDLVHIWNRWWEQFCESYPSKLLLDWDKILKFWTTLFGDVHNTLRSINILLQWHGHVSQRGQGGQKSLMDIPDVTLPFEGFNITDLAQITYRHVLGTTTSHRIGLFEHDVEANDQIVLFSGATTPYVLRPTQQYNVETGISTFFQAQNRLYKLIGPCYVYGLMNGEERPESLEGYTEITLV